jgi:hypothetical protein
MIRIQEERNRLNLDHSEKYQRLVEDHKSEVERIRATH